MVMTQAFNGAGDTRTPTKINFISFWLFQLPLAYISAMVLGWGATGVFVAITLAEVLIAVLAMIWFKKGKWKKVQV
jgi:Na+-driven multidrug efflux pump